MRPLMEIIVRIPILLLTALYALIVFQGSGQIGALFPALDFPRDHLLLLAIALFTTVTLAVLMGPSLGSLRSVDIALFAAPVVLVATLFFGATPGRVALAVVAGAAAISCILLIRRWPSGGKLTATLVLVVVVTWVLLHIAIERSPVNLPRAMGSIALILAFLGFCAAGLQFLIRLRSVGLAALLCIVVVFLTNEQTHELRQFEPSLASDHPPQRGSVSLQETFQVWLTSRNDLAEYRERGVPYPVFVVTSEGGGGYAAAHAFLFLSKLQRHCPNFAQHVFVIVGVSGGAVGNTMFRQSLPDTVNFAEFRGCEGESRSENDIDLLSTDHLSPVIAALLFQDFPNKLLFGLLGPRDRSSALIASLSSTFEGDEGQYWDHYWDVTADGAMRLGEGPAIVDVATNAVSGKRFVFAPFSFSFPAGRFEEAVHDLNWEGPDEAGPRVSDVGFIDAAVASASFPYVTPSVVLDGKLQERVALVDGGYLDNSGAETLRDIVAELQSPNIAFDGATINGIAPPSSWSDMGQHSGCAIGNYLQYLPIDPAGAFPGEIIDGDDPCRIDFSLHAITIRSAVPYRRSADQPNFFLDPLTAVASTRWRRAETARLALLSQLCGGWSCAPQVEWLYDWRLYESVVMTDYLTLPLGWFMPPTTIERLEKYVAPLPTDEFDLNAAPPSGMAAIIDWQSNKFGTMADNPVAMGYIQRALDPTQRN